MNNTLKLLIGFIFIAFILPISAVHAFPANASIDGPSNVSLLEDMTYTISVDVNNGDFHEQTVTITTKSSSPFIKAKPVVKTFVLPPYTHTTTGVDITATNDAANDDYDVTITVDVGGQKMDVPVKVYVGTNPFLTLNTFDKSVCANEYIDEVSVSVKNNTGSEKTVFLRAEQSILFPFFEEETIQLDSGDTEFVQFNVNTSPLNVGEYNGVILAQTSDIVLVRPFSVEVNDCPEPVEKTLSISVPTKIKDLVKTKTTLVPVTVKNLTKVVQEVSVYTSSIIPSESQSLFMGPNSTAIVNVPLTPGLDIAAGTYPVQFIASASGYTVSQTVNAKVLPIDLLEMHAATNIFTLVEGQSKTMTLIVDNRGDSTQTVTMGVQNTIPDITFSFAPSAFSLAPGKSTVVELSVSAKTNATIDSVNTTILATGSKSSATLGVAFDVLSQEEIAEGLIEIVAHPEYIETTPDAQKKIVIALHNPTENTISGVHFKLVGVKGADMAIVQEQSIVLTPHETENVTLTLVTQETTLVGTYSPVLVVESPDATSSVAFTVNVKNPGFLSAFTGLFLFLGDKAALIGLIILIVILALWLVSRNKKGQAWVESKPAEQ